MNVYLGYSIATGLAAVDDAMDGVGVDGFGECNDVYMSQLFS